MHMRLLALKPLPQPQSQAQAQVQSSSDSASKPRKRDLKADSKTSKATSKPAASRAKAKAEAEAEAEAMADPKTFLNRLPDGNFGIMVCRQGIANKQRRNQGTQEVVLRHASQVSNELGQDAMFINVRKVILDQPLYKTRMYGAYRAVSQDSGEPFLCSLNHLNTESSSAFNMCAVRAVNAALGFARFTTFREFHDALKEKLKEPENYATYLFLKQGGVNIDRCVLGTLRQTFQLHSDLPLEQPMNYKFVCGKPLSEATLLYFLRDANHFVALLSLMCFTTRAVLRIDRSPAFGEQTRHSHMIAVELCEDHKDWHFDLCEGEGWMRCILYWNKLQAVMCGITSLVICSPSISPNGRR